MGVGLPLSTGPPLDVPGAGGMWMKLAKHSLIALGRTVRKLSQSQFTAIRVGSFGKKRIATEPVAGPSVPGAVYL